MSKKAPQPLGACELLESLESRGLHFSLDELGHILAGPPAKVTDEVGDIIKARKGDLIFALLMRANRPLTLPDGELIDRLMLLRNMLDGDFKQGLVDEICARLTGAKGESRVSDDTPPSN